MQLDQSFEVDVPPDAVYAFLLDVHRVAACIPGVSAVEERDPDTFLGTLRVKVGPIGVSYKGTAVITARDPDARSATISAEGTEGVGAGRVRATAVMTVRPGGRGSIVRISTELSIAGRLAQFGRGMIDAVARRMVGEMADCIRARLETSPAQRIG